MFLKILNKWKPENKGEKYKKGSLERRFEGLELSQLTYELKHW